MVKIPLKGRHWYLHRDDQIIIFYFLPQQILIEHLSYFNHKVNKDIVINHCPDFKMLVGQKDK